MEGNELGAAFGLAQLKNLSSNILTRQNNFQTQCKFFNKHKKYFSPPLEQKNVKTAWLAFPVLINQNVPFSRKELQIFLEKRNIQTRVVFTGNILRQPMMKNVSYKKTAKELINSDQIMQRGVLLPLHHGMTNEMFDILHEKIKNFLNSY